MDFTALRVLTALNAIAWLSLGNFLLACNGLASDINCLQSMKVSLEDPFNYLSSWNFSNTTEGFICTFTGIECWKPDQNRVLNIRLADMGLKGQFPTGLANCTVLTGLDLSSNDLFGPIPSSISRMIPFITSLDLSSNHFSGEIPPEIANLRYLNILKLDNNQLTGQIPHVLGQLGRIKSFSVANNQLSGPVPYFVQANVSAESYAKNSGLCGGPLPHCKPPENNNHGFFVSGFMVGFSVSAVVVFALTLFYLPTIPLKKIISSSRKKKRNQEVVQGSQWPTTNNRNEASMISRLEKFATRISFTELVNATDNFSEENVIGRGTRGTMYKAVLSNGWFLAVKMFYEPQGSVGHWVSEIMALGRLRHPNLEPLLGFCYETEDRLLVYKYMSNGNLYDWLHPPKGEPKVMEWPLRVKIGIGLARGLAWLHHNCKFRVFHQNISSKSILLDNHFEPKISNFWEAKFLDPNETASGGSSIANGELFELGFDKKDVYSFGIVLLELVTGKATDSAVSSDCPLAEWIINLSSTSFSLCDSVDNSLIGVGFDDEIFQFLRIASKCIQSFPDQRPTMLEVYQTMRAVGEKHGLVDNSEMWKQMEITYSCTL